MQQVRTVTDKPVTTIINTHTHGDHVGSNEFFPAAVEVVAHANTKANMEKMPAFAGDKAQFLPDRTYTDSLTLGTGADRIDLRHFGAGHTNGDTIVVFPALKVAHTGDLFAASARRSSTPTTAAPGWRIRTTSEEGRRRHHRRGHGDSRSR